MNCPVCGRSVRSSDPEMPFCSERCRAVDLGHWASENYVISTPLEFTPAAPAKEDEED